MAIIIPIHQWETHEFSWCTAVKEQQTNKWTNLFLKPDGQEIKVDQLNVILHENGIEFI